MRSPDACEEGKNQDAPAEDCAFGAPGTSSGTLRDFANRRLNREWRTVLAMLQIHCRERHGGNLCDECQGLANYAHLRLDRCRFGADKPTCAKCPVHCYQRDRREQIKSVMRYAGPRMLWEHPWLSLCHLLDGWFRRPDLATAGRKKCGAN